jgi:hypothetical protein
LLTYFIFIKQKKRFPHDFIKKNSNVVIFDFGRLIFTNNTSSNSQPFHNMHLYHYLSHQQHHSSLHHSLSFANNYRRRGGGGGRLYSATDRRNSDSNMLTMRVPEAAPRNKSSDIIDHEEAALGDMDNGEDAEDEADDIYATPIATPPPEICDNLNSSNPETARNNPNSTKLDLNPYSNFTLKLNELQVINGNLQTDNLQFYLNKGHSSYHLLEKFDINIQIGLSKLIKARHRQQKNVNGELFKNEAEANRNPPIKIEINVNLLKLNIDDIKIINIYRTWANFKKFLDSANARSAKKSTISSSNKTRMDFFNASATSAGEAAPTTSTTKSLVSYVAVNLKLNEVDITMSLSRDGSQNLHDNMNELYLIENGSDMMEHSDDDLMHETNDSNIK